MNMFIRTTHPDMSDQTTFDENMFVVSSGYYNLKTKNLSCTRPNGRSDYFLYYVLKGKSRYVMNGEECFAEAGDVGFYIFTIHKAIPICVSITPKFIGHILTAL